MSKLKDTIEKREYRLAIVDDEEVVLDYINDLIDEELPDVLSIHEFKDFSSFIKANEEAPFDILISDINLDKEKSDNQFEQLKKNNPLMSIITITGGMSLISDLTCYESGVDYMFKKPIDQNDFLFAIEAIIFKINHWQRILSAYKKS